MDTGFKQTMKNVVFLWGAISLGLIIIIMLYMMTSNIRHHNKLQEKTEETLHEKTFGDVKLVIVGKYGNKDPEVVISVTRNNKQIISNYVLPTHENGFDYVRFFDSNVSPVEPGKYHIMLFTVADDCEHPSNQVWFLSLDDQMKFIKVHDLFEMRRSESGEGSIIGNKHFRLPYVHGCNNRQYVVPAEVNAKGVITIANLLNDRGANLLRADFEKDVTCIHNKLSQFPDQSKTEAARVRSFLPYDQFMKKLNSVQQEFNETLKSSFHSW